MDRLKYIIPTKEYKDKAIDYINEFYKYHSRIHGVGELDKYLDDYDAWLIKLSNDRSRNLSKMHFPTETYFLVRESDDSIVGMINIRLTSNDSLIDRSGHIGYSIRPTERRKGYAKINLYMGLKCLNEHNIDVALVFCVKSNLASSKTMLSLGAKKYDESYSDKYKEVIEKYKIDVNKSLNEYAFLYYNI